MQNGAPKPDWAGFFSADEWQRFCALVIAHHADQGIDVSIDEGMLVVPQTQHPAGRMGLSNLAQRCHELAPEAWPSAIAEHFRRLEEGNRGSQEMVKKPFDEAAPNLAARIYPRAALGGMPMSNFVCRADIDETITMAVLDLPTSVASLTPGQVATWGQTDDAIFARALANVAAMPTPTVTPIGDGNLSVTLYSADSHFVATMALMLDRLPGAVGRHGALFGIPNRHCVVAFAIEDQRVLEAIGPMIAMIARLERDGPGSITRNLYFWHNGLTVKLPYEIQGNKLQFAPPPEFVALLELLVSGAKPS